MEPSSPTPFRPRTLIRDQVFAHLAEEIVSGRLQPHDEIRDQDLQNEYGVSRTPIREAIIRLVDAGLVEMSANRFTRVAPVDLTAQADRAESASALISYCAFTACPTYTPDQRTAILHRIDALLLSDLTRSAMRDGLKLWFTLWALIVDAAGNRVILDLLNDRLALHLTRTVLTRPIDDALAAFNREQLEHMRVAVVDGDGAALRDRIVTLFTQASVLPLRAAAATLQRD
ncbi:GntR family transcriptional regulator [Leucobacter japonicus]|uniref:GntR family transcriptional regulator n=1 Tax=Leucobacter japonicus TaxID=1461259 RepID=UPI0006A7C034|nr:GntR family transcriptional regulator [Leucobacter japonicus]